jgi:hypothetical protein
MPRYKRKRVSINSGQLRHNRHLADVKDEREGAIMADQTSDDGYNYFPPITIGGPTGDYFVTCPVTSCQWAEFAVDTIVNGDGGTGAIVISSDRVPVALDYTGSSSIKFSDDVQYKGWPVRIPSTTTQYINSDYERIINSQKRVFLRIDAAASTSMYVTLRFRVKQLAITPGPAPTVHPDHMHKLNQARAETTKQRLQEMGVPGYAEEE